MGKWDKYKKNKNKENVKQKDTNNGLSATCINWYPGHMAKTKRLIEEKYNLIDVVYEVIDARIPYSSKIKDIDNLLKDKPRVLIMTKKDLCDINETNKWKSYYENLGYKVVLVDLSKNNDLNDLVNITNSIMADKQVLRESKGLNKKEIRVLVVGIPNVGKSTLINRLVGKNVAITGNNPGVTKNLSWLKTKSNILLLDSPGILWPKLDNEEVALNLASMAAIPRDILPIDKVAIHILSKLDLYYNSYLESRYKIDSFDVDNIVDIYEEIGHTIGAIVSGGEVDYDRVSRTILEDIKSNRIKEITFDRFNLMQKD